MRTLDVAEAQARFAELIRDVERGESVAIACDGKTVARLAPAPQEPARPRLSEEEVAAAMERLRKLREELKPAGITREEILSWIHDGHKI